MSTMVELLKQSGSFGYLVLALGLCCGALGVVCVPLVLQTVD